MITCKAESPRGDAAGGAWPMPIFRYFLRRWSLARPAVRGELRLPTSPVTQAVATASNEQPLIRIRSDRHLPERVVLDTSQPTLAAPAVKIAAVAAPQPPVEGMSPALAEISAKARVRETFAQFTPAAKADAAAVKKAEAKTHSRKFRRRPSSLRTRPLRSRRSSPSARSPGRIRCRSKVGR